MSFETGDKVWDACYGEGIIITIYDSKTRYPIKVLFDVGARERYYTPQGKNAVDSPYPALYHYGTKLIPAPEPVRCPFKEYDRVLVRRVLGGMWELAFFDEFCPKDGYPYRVRGCALCGCGATEAYKYCISFEKHNHLLGTTKNIAKQNQKNSKRPATLC